MQNLRSGILIIILVSISTLFSDNKGVLQYDKYFILDDIQESVNKSVNFNPKITISLETKEITGVFSPLLKFYKKVISSQDLDVCTFTPSCSEYASLSFSRFSFVIALLKTGDRLLRCHNFNIYYYPHDPKTRLNIDYPK